MPDVRISLRHRGQRALLRSTLDSVIEHSPTTAVDVEVLTSSAGDDLAFLRGAPFRDRVRVCVIDGRRPRPHVGHPPYIVFLEPGCHVSSACWLQDGLAALTARPDASMVQAGVTLRSTHKPSVEGGSPDCRTWRSHTVFANTWRWPYDDPVKIVFTEEWCVLTEPYEAMAGAGAMVFTEGSTLLELGAGDSAFEPALIRFLDLGIRGWLEGRPLLIAPHVRVEHEARQLTPAQAVRGVLSMAYKYLSPRRIDHAVAVFRRHDLHDLVDRSIAAIRASNWLEERVQHERRRVRDDDWLFERFGVYEEEDGLAEW